MHTGDYRHMSDLRAMRAGFETVQLGESDAENTEPSEVNSLCSLDPPCALSLN
jgi:hypothetical protein